MAEYYADKTSRPGVNKHHLVFMLKKIIQIAVYASAIIVILYVFKVDLTGAIVGLGIGGIAIAFALQSALSDFFGAFSIYTDRPFEIGDFITVGEYSGTVTNISIRSTRLKLLSGEELIMPNKELTTAIVRNFRKLERRRITFTIGVTYDTPTEKQRNPNDNKRHRQEQQVRRGGTGALHRIWRFRLKIPHQLLRDRSRLHRLS